MFAIRCPASASVSAAAASSSQKADSTRRSAVNHRPSSSPIAVATATAHLLQLVPELLLRVSSRSPPTSLRHPPAASVGAVADLRLLLPLSLARKAGMGLRVSGSR